MKRLKVIQIFKIKELSKKGLTERAIAKKIGCSRSAVWYWLNKGKIKITLSKNIKYKTKWK